MQEPTLVVLAAGMGSRFGGLKQITAVDDAGHAILDFSLFDAWRAGFRRVVFIIKEAIAADFIATVGSRAAERFQVDYVYQELDKLPEGFTVPAGRVKPWGTGHAVACCRGTVDGPFAVINSDDFYGPGAFQALYDFLSGPRAAGEHAMVGYELRKTLTESGSVSRGICAVENGILRSVTERTRIEKRGDGAAYTEDGSTFHPLGGDETVSMNCWGFGPEILDTLWAGLPAFLEQGLAENPLRCEYYLPFVVDEEIRAGRADVRVLPCREQWHGVTYQEDLALVKEAVSRRKQRGEYPESF